MRTNESTQVGANTIKDIAHQARDRHDQLVGECFQVSESIQELFRRRFDIELGVRELQVGEPRVTHFVNTLPMSKYADGGDEGYLLIDGSIQQFSMENKLRGRVKVGLGQSENLPETALYQPECEERLVWYTKPNSPDLIGRLDMRGRHEAND